MRVLKWPLETTGEPQEIGGGPVVLVASQDGVHVTVWTLEEAEPRRRVRLVGTGHSVAFDARHLGSVVTQAGRYVWHVFEEEPR